jgi:exosortase
MTTRTKIAAGLALVVAFGFLYREVIPQLVEAWRTDDNYSHGFLILPIACFLAWERRNRLLTTKIQPTVFGLALIAGSLAVLAVGILGSEFFLARISMIGTLSGIVLFLFGWKHLRILAFPLAVLLLMIPLPSVIFNELALPLQLMASRLGELIVRSFGVPVLREGNTLILANTTLEVSEACSGIRSLVSLLTLAMIVAHLADSRRWARSAIAIASVPVAIIANAARVAGTGIGAHYVGPDVAEDFFHKFSGWVVFVVAFALTIAVQRAIARFAPEKIPSQAVQEAV